MGRRLRERQAGDDQHRPGLGDAPDLRPLSHERGPGLEGAKAARRPYHSPVRRRQAAETRERIVVAGTDILHEYPVWNWSALTVRAVADRAGVNERTVYRYFSSERELRDVVLARLRDEAGIDLEGLGFGDLPDVAARILRYVSSFPVEPRVSTDPAVAAENVRQRSALRAALRSVAGDWSARDRQIAAGILDVLWSPASYERLVLDWKLPPEEAIRGITWLIRLVQHAVEEGSKP